MIHVRRLFATTLIAAAAVLNGCGGSPPSGDAKSAIHDAIIRGHVDKFGVSISLDGWAPSKDATDGKHFVASWMAKVSFPEPYGYLMMRVDNRDVVHVAAKEGAVATLQGEVTAEKTSNGWRFDVPSGDPWVPFRTIVGQPLGYSVVNGSNVDWELFHTASDEGCPLQPLSSFRSPVREDSAEGDKIIAAVDNQVKAAEAARVERANNATQKTAADRQKAADERQRQQAAEYAKLAVPRLKPFESSSGAIVVTGTGDSMGSVITEAHVDEATSTVKGAGIDLRQMPFRPFTFDATVDARTRGVVFHSPLLADPIQFGTLSRGKLSDGTYELAALDDETRGEMDKLIALGQQLGSAPALNLSCQILTAAEAAQRERALQSQAMAGILTLNGKKTVNYDGLFSGKVGGQKVFRWKDEAIGVRLASTASASGLFLEGSTADSQGVRVTLNGIHAVKIDPIPKGGAAIITLPADLQILDARFEAQGTFQTHGIMLIK